MSSNRPISVDDVFTKSPRSSRCGALFLIVFHRQTKRNQLWLAVTAILMYNVQREKTLVLSVHKLLFVWAVSIQYLNQKRMLVSRCVTTCHLYFFYISMRLCFSHNFFQLLLVALFRKRKSPVILNPVLNYLKKIVQNCHIKKKDNRFFMLLKPHQKIKQPTIVYQQVYGQATHIIVTTLKNYMYFFLMLILECFLIIFKMATKLCISQV